MMSLNNYVLIVHKIMINKIKTKKVMVNKVMILINNQKVIKKTKYLIIKTRNLKHIKNHNFLT